MISNNKCKVTTGQWGLLSRNVIRPNYVSYLFFLIFHSCGSHAYWLYHILMGLLICCLLIGLKCSTIVYFSSLYHCGAFLFQCLPHIPYCNWQTRYVSLMKTRWRRSLSAWTIKSLNKMGKSNRESEILAVNWIILKEN